MLFVLGVANFALHKAVLESDHPILDTLPGMLRRNGGRMSLALEFLVLLVAMLLAAGGWSGVAWLYGGYSLVNALGAWLVLEGRI